MFNQEFFIRGVHRGSARRLIELRTRSAPPSLAFFCPQCGDIWARCPVEGQSWMVMNTPCDKCGQVTVLDVPGSLWLALEDEFNNALPRELLLREFDLALEYNQHLESTGIRWDARSSTTEAVHGPLASAA